MIYAAYQFEIDNAGFRFVFHYPPIKPKKALEEIKDAIKTRNGLWIIAKYLKESDGNYTPVEYFNGDKKITIDLEK